MTTVVKIKLGHAPGAHIYYFMGKQGPAEYDSLLQAGVP